MGKGIKTREVVKNIKVHDTAVNVGDRMKNIGVKTKDTVNENINQADNAFKCVESAQFFPSPWLV